MRNVSPKLYTAISDAQRQTQDAHNLAHKEGASFFLRVSLGRAQSTLIHWQVKLASKVDHDR